MENGSFAVNRSPEDMVKQFQIYLRKYENDDKLVILEAVEKPGSKLGDNYTSVMTKTKLIGTRGNGSRYVKSFMVKMIVQDTKISTLVNLPLLFRMEAHAYTKVLPVLGAFGPSYICADPNIIIMEDLAEKGYVNCERRNYLDLDHTVYALKKLAKLHASGVALKINNRRQFDALTENLEEIIYTDNSETAVLRTATDMCIKTMMQYLDLIEPQTQGLQDVKDYMATWENKCYDTLYRLFTSPKQKYDAFCHGDPWVNNLLFLHDNDGRIIDLKMVDYQILRYTSITTDIFYLIYSSVRSSLIEKSFDSLIKIHHNEFINELRRLHVDEKNLAQLGMEWLQSELQAYSVYGLLVGCFFINPILAEEEDVKEFENMEFGPVSMNPASDIDMNLEINRKKLDRIKCVLFQYYRRFRLGIVNDDSEPILI